jgi:hypothetical protein
MRHTAPDADRYAISPIQGTQVVRVTGGEPNQPPEFAVRCACGFKAGSYGSPAMAEDIRETHEALCSWPTS